MNHGKIAVLTATRAEYGLLKPLIRRIAEDDELELQLLVTGTHLSQAFGNTCQEILDDGFPIAVRIPILGEGDSGADTSRAMARALEGFGVYFADNRPDMLIVLGDRYEALAVCLAAMNACIPIAHIHGGEITEGAADDAIRHAITKLSYLHFPTTEAYARRIVQLGESPDRVFTVGALGVENIRNTVLLSREELSSALQFSLEAPYAVVTFHPVTLEQGDVRAQVEELFAALDACDMRYLITKANADTHGRTINEMIDDYSSSRPNVCAVASLGMKRYLSAVKYSEMVIGNSSSGIVEAPTLGVPTVDIGDRQRGRLAAESVIHCGTNREEIGKAMDRAREWKYRGGAAHNPYAADSTSMKILSVCKEFLFQNRIDLMKRFYDLPSQRT